MKMINTHACPDPSGDTHKTFFHFIRASRQKGGQAVANFKQDERNL